MSKCVKNGNPGFHFCGYLITVLQLNACLIIYKCINVSFLFFSFFSSLQEERKLREDAEERARQLKRKLRNMERSIEKQVSDSFKRFCCDILMSTHYLSPLLPSSLKTETLCFPYWTINWHQSFNQLLFLLKSLKFENLHHFH